jgi:hypothetical protein
MDAQQTLPSFWSSSATPTLVQVLCTKLLGPRAVTLQNPPQHLRPLAGVRQLTLADIPQASVVTNERQTSQYVQFLTTHFFGQAPSPLSPAQPQASLTVEQVEVLRERGGRYLLWRSPTGAPIGCIASLPLGRLRRVGSAPTDYEVRLIRDFCVAPTHRGRGIGNGLLQAILADSRALGQDAAIFLKEGAPIGRAGPSLYSSSWMYRRYKQRDMTIGVREIAAEDVDNTLALFYPDNPRLVYNVPRDASATATRVFFFRGFTGSVMAAFTPAYQRHPDNNTEIIYQTGWVERGNLMPMERIEATRALSAFAAREMGAGWIWMDRAIFGGQRLPSPWKADGLFHWYAYNWTAGYYGNVPLFLRA